MKCPDELDIQAYLDGENSDPKIARHVHKCSRCRMLFNELEQAFMTADKLDCTDTLSSGFYQKLEQQITPRPFPAVAMAALILVLAGISLYYLNPGYLQWWLSAGITRQLSIIIDASLNILYLSRAAGEGFIIATFGSLVALEILLLNILGKVEGKTNV